MNLLYFNSFVKRTEFINILNPHPKLYMNANPSFSSF